MNEDVNFCKGCYRWRHARFECPKHQPGHVHGPSCGTCAWDWGDEPLVAAD